MTNGIGNPDWQRRYSFSAVPLLELTYPDSLNSISNLIDSNGFQYLLVTTNSSGSNTLDHVKIDWFQDANASIAQGHTDYTIAGQTFIVQKVPVVTRYFKLEIGPVGGASGGSIVATVYATNTDQENLLTQNTAQPLFWNSVTIGAGLIQTNIISGMFGGRVSVSINDNSNNKWVAWLEYYDWTTQTWNIFYLVRGADRGQSWTEFVNLPYTPCRINVFNGDTVGQLFTYSVIAP